MEISGNFFSYFVATLSQLTCEAELISCMFIAVLHLAMLLGAWATDWLCQRGFHTTARMITCYWNVVQSCSFSSWTDKNIVTFEAFFSVQTNILLHFLLEFFLEKSWLECEK